MIYWQKKLNKTKNKINKRISKGNFILLIKSTEWKSDKIQSSQIKKIAQLQLKVSYRNLSQCLLTTAKKPSFNSIKILKLIINLLKKLTNKTSQQSNKNKLNNKTEKP